MITKMYTAILSCNGRNKVINTSVSPDRNEAQEEMRKKYPNHELVALIPGNHADWTKVYQLDEESNSQRKSQNTRIGIKDIDIWAMPNELPTE